ncbi:DNA polymerase alpha, subunit B [Fistulina hepatica ATCC 64428]|uniref:DNA polymerase alpha subunit B n=1 Tax=Fistulina hepatica ATCC 64428 TaxID=1128425 RepID=A0A0D7A6M5_9AGAR|nr:DNA polymerase alpha, subunit B [Fistulina hepatica ATCC 64428]
MNVLSSYRQYPRSRVLIRPAGVTLSKNYNISPEALKFKWEAIEFNSRKKDSALSVFTKESIAAMRTELNREADKQKFLRMARLPVGSVRGRGMPDPMRRKMNSSTPALVQIKQELSTRNLAAVSPSNVAGPSKVTFSGPSSPQACAFLSRVGACRPSECVLQIDTSLDTRIDDFGKIVEDSLGVQISDPSLSTDEDVVIVGRITSDWETNGASKLTESTMVIEPSRYYGSGNRVPLRFDPSFKIRGGPPGLTGMSFFPGEIVALKGKNGGGGWFSVHEALILPLPKVSNRIETDDSEFTMTIACGPFTAHDNLEYVPWLNFVSKLSESKPDVVLLVGPFVDCTHPLVKQGDIDDTPLSLFRRTFVDPIQKYLSSNPGSIAVIVPSVHDLISTHAAYPQPSLDSDLISKNPRIYMVPNPSRFSINGISLSVTSVDVLFHLKKEEYIKHGTQVEPGMGDEPDPMGNLCRHLLYQRSFYPLFPVPEDPSHIVNLDVSHWGGLAMYDADNPGAPDVLVVPSRLRYFAKGVDGVTAVNPSYANKNTYANMRVAPGSTPATRDRIAVTIDNIHTK